MGFHKALSEEEVEKVKRALKTLDGKEVVWSALSGALSISIGYAMAPTD